MNQSGRVDLDLREWLGADRVAAPSDLLPRILAVTDRTTQRPAVLAVLAGAPTMGRQSFNLGRSTIALAAALLGLLAAALVGVGYWLTRDDLLVVNVSPPPSVAPEASTGLPTRGPGTLAEIHLVPGTTARFSAALPPGWRPVPPAQTGTDAYMIVTRSELVNFDPVAVGWVTVRASTDSVGDLLANLQATGWNAEPTPIDIPGLEGVIASAGNVAAPDPTALVAGPGLVYLVAVHDDSLPGLRMSFLRGFLQLFRPLGFADPAAVYRDTTWRFAFAYEGAGDRFRAARELGGGVTRFDDAECPATPAEPCASFVDVVRLPNRSPLDLTLPDGRHVGVGIDPAEAEYVRLAADWEVSVGRSRGSMTIPAWQGSLIYEVDNSTFVTRFIHREEQWLVLLAPGPLDVFLEGFVLAP